MKAVFGNFQGKIAWILLLLAVTSQTAVSCGDGDDGDTLQVQATATVTESVIGVHEIDVNTLEDYTLKQIDKMNKGNKNYEVEMNEFGYVSHIYGRYSEIKVDSEDTVLASLYNVKSIIGMDDPSEELQVGWTYINEFSGCQFEFDQMYKGIQVFDRGVSVSVDRNGKLDYLVSSYLPIAGDRDVRPELTMEEAAEYAKKAGYGEWDDDGKPEEEYLYIYNENGTGIPVWLMYCGNDETFEYYMVLVDAKTGEVVYQYEFVGCW